MYPELLHLGPLTVYSFGVMAAIALIGGVLVAWLLVRRYGVPFEYVFEACMVTGLSGFGGARLYYMVQHWSEVRTDLLGSTFGGAGFTWYGGFAGGFVGLVLWAKWRHIPLGLGANAVAAGIAFGYAVGRIGCQLSGDGDYGRPSDLPWAMGYPHGVVPTGPGVTVHPTPVYETLAMLAVFAVLYRMASRPQPGWYVFGWFLVLQGVERFLVEFLRLNPDFALGLTGPQWIGVASAVAGVVVILVTRRRPPVGTQAGAPSGETPQSAASSRR